MKKIILPLIVILVVAVSMCVSPNNNSGPDIDEVGPFMIGETMDLPQLLCEEHNLSGKVVVIHQTGCEPCETAVIPVLKEIERELNLTFEYIDLKVDPSRIDELNIYPFYVPTVIVDCTAYVSKQSIWSKEKYETIIRGRIGTQ